MTPQRLRVDDRLAPLCGPHSGVRLIEDEPTGSGDALLRRTFEQDAEAERAAVAALRNRVAELTNSLDATGARLREARRLLLAAHERLALGDRELHELIHRLVAERDAAALRIPELVEERDAYRAQLERIRGSLPGRLYRLARKILRRA